MDPNKYFSGYNLKNAERKQKFGYANKWKFGQAIFTLSPAAYVTADFKKFVCDLFHAGSPLVECESMKRKTRLSEKPRNIIDSKPFHM